MENSIAAFKKKNNIESSQEIEQEIEEKDKLIEKKQEEVQLNRQQQQELLREKDKIEYQLQTMESRLTKVKEIEKQNQDQIKDLQQKKKDFKTATLKLNQCLDQDSSFASQLANARRKMSELQESQARLNAKNMSVQAGISANKALEALLKEKDKFKGIHGTISELGQVQKKYALSLEMAAGPKMQQLVVETDQVAADCISHLKKNKLGSLSFIPLNKIKTHEVTAEDKNLLKLLGVHDFAINLISFKPQYKKAFSYVFGNTLVVDNINIARNVGISRIKMVTLEGDIAEASGVMRGGFITAKYHLGFKEKDSLEELGKIETELSDLQNVFSALEVKREANEKEISFLRNQKAEMEAVIITLEKVLHLDTADLDVNSDLSKELKTKLKEVDSNLMSIQKKVGDINHELAELKTKKQDLRSQVNELRNPRLLAQLSAFEESKQNSKEELMQMNNELKNSQAQMEQLIAPEKEKISEIFKQQDKEESKFGQEIKDLTEHISKEEKELLLKEKESKEFYSRYHQLFNQREKLTTEINQSENEIEKRREKSREQERDANLVSLKNAEIKAKLAGLGEEFSKYKDVQLLSNKNLAELQEEVSKHEVMLAQMSTVNMKALEIYDAVEKEYNSLTEKKSSLDKEKTEIMTLMNEIETKKKDHFMKTFEQANNNFQRIFLDLFKKGHAYLQLDNPDNPFEDGLSVRVKLTGKRFLDIKSLSGGEKTLTALSFIFAIQEYQPASFYILDEIDAALDKHNSETLSKMIRSYSDRAQYIVISHNDSLISEADILYGISMNEEGISKVTSLQL